MFMNRYTLDNNSYKWKEQHEYKLNLKVSVVGGTQRIIAVGKKIFFFVKIQLYEPGDIYQIVVYEMA